MPPMCVTMCVTMAVPLRISMMLTMAMSIFMLMYVRANNVAENANVPRDNAHVSSYAGLSPS